MATSFGQAWVFAIKFCHDYGIQMTDQQLHDFCNLLIEFRDGSRPTPRAVDGADVCHIVTHVFIDGTCAMCGFPEPRPAGKA